MTTVLGALLRRMMKWRRFWRARWQRRLWLLRYPGRLHLPWPVAIEPGVELKLSDGGRMAAGPGLCLGAGSSIVVKRGFLKLGRDVTIRRGVNLVCNEDIRLGDDCLVAEGVTIRDQDHGMQLQAGPYRSQPMTTAPVRIGRNVWLGAKATILKGVVIEADAVVGANAVVTHNVAHGDVVGGVPARVLTEYAQRCQ